MQSCHKLILRPISPAFIDGSSPELACGAFAGWLNINVPRDEAWRVGSRVERVEEIEDQPIAAH
jgi:hypothetical protein